MGKEVFVGMLEAPLQATILCGNFPPASLEIIIVHRLWSILAQRQLTFIQHVAWMILFQPRC